ncbi:FAD-dependent oxidoreductase [Nocardia tengchongensis]|uniref:FAD-dependent oxidoreductase n=1 Tax=Nocardia tengchongensis TaxID=2055889 RepID=UPI003611D6D0
MTTSTRPLRVAIVGAGPAGIYAADALMKSGALVSIDLYERMPAPFGLLRYGVAPDHPRIKAIVSALHKLLDKPQVRLLGNIDVGADITLDELRSCYDAVVYATGANADRALPIPGVDLEGSYGAADFVSWYDGHPDVPRTWPLDAKKVAVLGVGNVALDVARILAKTAEELLPTEIPPNVHAGLSANQAVEVHVFGRRGPAHARFTPLELRELDHSPTIEVIVDPADLVYDEAALALRQCSKQVELICSTLEQWAAREPGERPHRLFLHFCENPVELLGDGEGRVRALRTERTRPGGAEVVAAGGDHTDWEVQAVYRAIGYLSEPVPGVPFDECAGVIPNEAGRVLAEPDSDAPEQRYLPGVYVTGWIKRGPVGLIGHTKGDASETISSLLADVDRLARPASPQPEAVIELLESKGIAFTTWSGWQQLDAYERELGAAEGRERVKVVERDVMVAVSRSSAAAGDCRASIEP